MDSLQGLIRHNELIFSEHFRTRPLLTSTAPGRINIIGEHTDYNMGLAMPAAINRWIFVSIGLRKDKICHIISRDFNREMKFKLGGDFTPSENWQRYVFGAISVVHKLYQFPNGFNAVISGNVPIGSGVSSSAALEVALTNAIRSLYNFDFDDKQLIKLCQRVEHEFLHIQSGLLDQFASQFSRHRRLMIIDFKELTCEHFDAHMENFSWVVVDSGVKREIAQTKYMERVQECKEGLLHLQESGFSLNGFRDITKDHLKHLKGNIRKRLLHYINENSRVMAVKASILQHDFFQLGQLLNESHQSLKADYKVSCDELNFLVDTAIGHPGCIGARMMGGGFGGCTLNLVKDTHVSEFVEMIPKQYQHKFPYEIEAYRFVLVDGANVSFTESS